jgi:hypothetical protein
MLMEITVRHPVISFAPFFATEARFWHAEAERAHAEEEADDEQQSGPTPRKAIVDYSGPARLARIIRNFKSLQKKWETYQMRLFSAMICSILPLILRDDIDYCLNYIMKMYNWADKREEVFCVMPRQTGKTTAVAAVVACLAMEVPTYSCALYSITRERANELLGRVRGYMLNLWAMSYSHYKFVPVASQISVTTDDDLSDVRNIIAQSAKGSVCFFIFVCCVCRGVSCVVISLVLW